MTKDIRQYFLPAEDVNEDTAIITEVIFSNGDHVNKDDVIYTFETSKATVDVLSENEGHIKYHCLKGEEVQVGSLVCEISDKKIDLKETNVEKNVDTKITLTKKAAEYVEKNKIDITEINLPGVVREKDLKLLFSKSLNKLNITKNFNSNDVVVLGSGGHANVIKNIIDKNGDLHFSGFISKDSHFENVNSSIIGTDSDLLSFIKSGLAQIIIGIGDVKHRNILRAKIIKKTLALGIEIPNIIDPTAIIEKSVSLGFGNQVFAGAIIGHNCKVGNNNIINSGAIISHNVKIHDNVHVAPGAIIAADVVVGENSLIGMGVTIYRGVSIGKNVLIANGVRVLKNVQDNSTIT